MQLPIARINSTNHWRILEEVRLSKDKEKAIEDIKNVVLLMPHKSSIMASFISDLAKDDADFKNGIAKMIDEISTSNDSSMLISASFTLKRLGVKGMESFFWTKETPTISSLFECVSLEISQDSLNGCREEAERILGIAGEEGFEEVFCVVQAMRSFRFSVQECVSQLGCISRQKSLVDGIRMLQKKENSLYLCALALEFAKKQGFLKILLEELPAFEQEFKGILIPLLFEQYHNPSEESSSVYISSSYMPLRTLEDINPFKQLITEDIAKNMKRISGTSKVEKFLNEGKSEDTKKVPRMSREEFEKTDFEDRKAFFKSFCLLGSPSISHFLTYLEIYKENFVLGEDDQKLFLSIFFETFGDYESFCRIVIEKMVRFRIIDSELLAGFISNSAL
ncbi:hypothetical protein EHEL_080190 [Encephalitozoon hellem ATCC 50504]|uniref:MIF4G-like type 2 domain-containing protein n=1 Tax=Encephalitozoon hellem TaxID=27973 RepID=A0A9Q9CD21_ENCHE|nr:uncharacterized protein EHEL_080190 [Encephalitozoon hellem ATCC 50504]AFM98724.1 hypothetical protein EHEL_080190 [Encephalitozoon hellem ATCC 50504]UTX43699.1 hypothetical protein GPU96_08g14680 [Encephalitozoon hellem]WEL39175.1 hypothetical protein PFJ87_08g00330 [Encephalitozoon hellem]|eukprot:XP_003887705.1 hypothetical protein EHEL_080190 [Encephalitozoon hellem ATCC 50504]